MDTTPVDTTDLESAPLLVIDRFDQWADDARGTTRTCGCRMDLA